MRRPLRISTTMGRAVAVLALLVKPRPHRLSSAETGDAGLAERVRAALDGDTEGYRGLSVAFVDGGQISTALVGEAPGGPLFEIGSITKTMTGMLLADLVADGTVRAEETLASALPAVRFDDPDTASITLAELASHRSGLPRLAPGRLSLIRAYFAAVRGGNPYGQDVDALLASAAKASPGDRRGQVSYSNFGMALLGQALAAKAHKPYDQLVTDRLLRALGMADTVLQVPEPSMDGLAEGSTATGRRTEGWSGVGYVPAGIGPRSTAADMARFVAASLSGTAAGSDATRPRFDKEPHGRIGYAWFTDRYGDREITWHNGGTGGFRSYVGFDRSTQQGVVVLGNTDRDVDRIGLRLLGAEP